MQATPVFVAIITHEQLSSRIAPAINMSLECALPPLNDEAGAYSPCTPAPQGSTAHTHLYHCHHSTSECSIHRGKSICTDIRAPANYKAAAIVDSALWVWLLLHNADK